MKKELSIFAIAVTLCITAGLWNATAVPPCPTFGNDCDENCTRKTVWCGPADLPFGSTAREYTKTVASSGCIEGGTAGYATGTVHCAVTVYASCSEQCESYGPEVTGTPGGAVVSGPNGTNQARYCTTGG